MCDTKENNRAEGLYVLIKTQPYTPSEAFTAEDFKAATKDLMTNVPRGVASIQGNHIIIDNGAKPKIKPVDTTISPQLKNIIEHLEWATNNIPETYVPKTFFGTK